MYLRIGVYNSDVSESHKIIFSIQNFKTQTHFTIFALVEREMYVCTCKMVAHAVSKQI